MDSKFRMGLINRVSGEAIPEDEPIFIFRARDIHAIAVLTFYHTIAADPDHKEVIKRGIDEFRKFKEDNPYKMKEPGITQDHPYLHKPRPVIVTVMTFSDRAGAIWSDDHENSIDLRNFLSQGGMTEEDIRRHLEQERFGPPS